MCPPSSVCPSTSQRWGMSLWVFSSTSLPSSPQRCFTTKKTRRLQLSCLAVALTGRGLQHKQLLCMCILIWKPTYFIKTKGAQVERYCIYNTLFFLIFLTCNRKWSYFPWHSENATISQICLNFRGSKIVIEGENLDSVYRTIIRFKPNESHLKPVTRVQCSS